MMFILAGIEALDANEEALRMDNGYTNTIIHGSLSLELAACNLLFAAAYLLLLCVWGVCVCVREIDMCRESACLCEAV
jgi:hypothetical protein